MEHTFKRNVLVGTLVVWTAIFAVLLGGMTLGYWDLTQSASVAGFIVDWCFIGFVATYYALRLCVVERVEEALDIDDPLEHA